MGKALIIFGSTTGNTEEMAEMVKNVLDETGVEAELKNVQDVGVEDLIGEHDLLLLGCPAYGDDTIELQEDFEEFYGQLDGVKLNGKPFAVFAPGDSSYEYFCGSVDMLEEKMTEMGGKLVQDGLKIDGVPGDFGDDISEWAHVVAGDFS